MSTGILAGPAFAQAARVTMQGTGEVSATPDLARVSLGVSHQAPTAAAALAQMSTDMTAVLASLSDAGITGADVQTSALRLDVIQDYDRDNNVSRVTGYRASTDVSVTVTALDRLGEVLDAVVQSGANQMNGLTFDVSNRQTLLDEARRAAVADAMRKAALYTDAADVALGRLTSLSEAGMNAAPAPMMRMAMEDAMSVPIAEGEVTISASVTMTWGEDMQDDR
ncbi:SIMPL domain-containing protein [Loktanella sp. TSTF-M6]|uniref:SIMPL domain-containing protein n=1 Tax=Loktanella gaetbuli TaxID=2881335 RepID=A0ABS8BVK4_9RHOB|nr:SIMPL domain-containing protein [Loktanella gaetbuli]MCB5199744.1 SIMPL domain-containing protein [Loktanella gaetbuli]